MRSKNRSRRIPNPLRDGKDRREFQALQLRYVLTANIIASILQNHLLKRINRRVIPLTSPARNDENMTSLRLPAPLGRTLAQLLATLFLGSQLFFAAAANPAASAPPQEASQPERLPLRNHWALQSSAKVDAQGETISTPTFVPQGW